MKKLITFVLVLAMVLSLAACGTKPAEDPAKTLGKAGTYTGEYDVLIITAADVVVENATANKILIAEEVGDGDVTLKNVTADILEIYGCKNSIHLIACKIGTVISHKEAGLVRVVAGEATTIETVSITNAALEVAPGASVGTVTANANTTVTVFPDATAGEVVVADTTAAAVVEGEVATLTVDAPAATVEVAETATVDRVEVTEAAEGAKVDIAGSVRKMRVAATGTETTVTETAKVEEVQVSETANDTALVVEGTVTKVDTDATTTVAGNGTVETVVTASKENLTLPENSNAAQGAEVIEKHSATTPAQPTAPTQPTTPVQPTTPAPETKPEETTPSTPSTGGSSNSHSHSYTIVDSETAATCTTEGQKVLKCSCGDSYTEVIAIDPRGHNVADNGLCDRCSHYVYKVAPNTDAQSKISNAPENAVILLSAGTYNELKIGENKGEIKGITIVGEKDTVVKGITVDTSTNAPDTGRTFDHLTFKNIAFEEKGIVLDFSHGTPYALISNVIIENCSFKGRGTSLNVTGNRLVDVGADSTGSNQLVNITIKNCTVSDAFQGIRLGSLYGENVISGNTISDVGHNAIALRSVQGGTTLVSSNTISNGADRAFRSATIAENVHVTFENNVIANTGDKADGSNWKVNTNNGTVIFTGNTVNGADWSPDAAESSS